MKFDKKCEELSLKYELTKAKYNELIDTRKRKKDKAIKMNTFLTNLKDSKDKQGYWDERV